MRWEDIGVVVVLGVAIATAAYNIGKYSSIKDEIERARNRVDELEKDIREWMTYWKRQ